MQLSFRDKLLVEQVRCMEEAGALVVAADGSSGPGAGDLPSLLAGRARAVVRQQGLESRVRHAARLSRRFALGLAVIAAFAGGLAVQQAVVDSTGGLNSTLNIYWLMLVLLGFHFLSLALWLAGMLMMGSTGSGKGLLGALWHWLESRILRGDPQRATADRGWLLTCRHGAAGRWWLAGLSHSLWIVYLSAGFVVLLLLLMTRQYDFIWATTILADDVFVAVTQWLAGPLDALGFGVPDLEQVRLSQYGGEHLSPEAARRAWAFFLLGGVLVYGVLPRLLLLGLSRLLELLARRRYQLDLTLPYYVNLRRELMPESCDWKVIDPDSAPHAKPEAAGDFADAGSLPQQALWVGVELAAATAWPPSRVGAGEDLGQVTGSASLAKVLDRLRCEGDGALVVAVSLQRLPDRGLRRTLDNLYDRCAAPERWLAVLRARNPADTERYRERLDDWMVLARACGVPDNQRVIVDLEET